MTDARLSPLEWRLYSLAVLAGVYLFTWLSMASPGSPASATAPAPEPAPIAVRSIPAPAIPPGWRLVSPGEVLTAPAPAPAPRLVRAPPARRARVRTRSFAR